MKLPRTIHSGETANRIEGLLSQHPRIDKRTLELRLDEFIQRLSHYQRVHVPAFLAYRDLRQRITQRERAALRLDEFKPRPLSTFVRNKLINEVYLHFIGDNFAKQMGAAGSDKRSDFMGLLLLISPPGYGKTTIMEYLAQRLGLIFMKINCPTLGHSVTSIDPQEAPNATARQELEKLNLALEMGNNVMLYLDDIQHSHPEFLQKFISMADAQRKIEGVWRGRSRTYDLRGKRFCLVMAGNPYTESGDVFKIPDMLANRADIYNLGDILHGRENVFALSYIENALTSNTILAPLAARAQSDVYQLVRLAQGQEVDVTSLSHNYSSSEINEIVSVLKKLFRVQEVILKVNQQYIASAAQADAYRDEPPFKLQGSYRNMNKLAEKIAPVMNETELENLISDHYLGEAQTLTNGAEENLLKLAELRGIMTPAQQTRWAEIKKQFVRRQNIGGADTDPTVRILSQLSMLGEHLGGIRQAIAQAMQAQNDASDSAEQQTLQALARHFSGIRSAILESAQKQGEALQAFKPDVHVHMPTGLETSVRQLVELIDASLLPVVQQFERRSRLDLMLWHRIKDISDTLKNVEKDLFQHKRPS
jgi:MoxR-like ATPase